MSGVGASSRPAPDNTGSEAVDGRKARPSPPDLDDDEADDEADDEEDLLPPTPSTSASGSPSSPPPTLAGGVRSAPLRSSLSQQSSGLADTPASPRRVGWEVVAESREEMQSSAAPCGINRAVQDLARVTAEDGFELVGRGEVCRWQTVGSVTRLCNVAHCGAREDNEEDEAAALDSLLSGPAGSFPSRGDFNVSWRIPRPRRTPPALCLGCRQEQAHREGVLAEGRAWFDAQTGEGRRARPRFTGSEDVVPVCRHSCGFGNRVPCQLVAFYRYGWAPVAPGTSGWEVVMTVTIHASFPSVLPSRSWRADIGLECQFWFPEHCRAWLGRRVRLNGTLTLRGFRPARQ